MTRKNISDKYLQRHHVDGTRLPQTNTAPDIIVVIPCYDEPDVLISLASLKYALVLGFRVEVIVVVNSGERTLSAVIEQNRRTYKLLQEESKLWKGLISLTPILMENVRHKHAGVGYARKVGMDLAVWRFNQNDNQLGVIASLDADTRIESNYFDEIYRCFKAQPRPYGVVVNFAHDIEGTEHPVDVYKAIMHYELHLRYVNQALKMSGYPYVHHTVGSAFAVRASAYVAHGGMNRRQGGEDFYFLHKLFPHGEFVELASTTVFPSSRPSHRVPFGTGPQVNEFLATQELLTYDMAAFLVLKEFVDSVPLLYKESPALSACMEAFLTTQAFEESLVEIRQNSASQASFVKRFFTYFDAFKVVKFLNFSHQHYFKKKEVFVQAQNFLEFIGEDAPADVKDLLLTYRKIEGK